MSPTTIYTGIERICATGAPVRNGCLRSSGSNLQPVGNEILFDVSIIIFGSDDDASTKISPERTTKRKNAFDLSQQFPNRGSPRTSGTWDIFR